MKSRVREKFFLRPIRTLLPQVVADAIIEPVDTPGYLAFGCTGKAQHYSGIEFFSIAIHGNREAVDSLLPYRFTDTGIALLFVV